MNVRRFLIAFSSFFFIWVAAVAGTPAGTTTVKMPPATYHQVLWDIQHQMTYTSKNETTVLLWTPQKINLQSQEAQAMPSLTMYAPNEVLRTYRFDVSMGHNMDATDIYWRTCEAQITQIDSEWGQPVVVCDSTAP